MTWIGLNACILIGRFEAIPKGHRGPQSAGPNSVFWWRGCWGQWLRVWLRLQFKKYVYTIKRCTFLYVLWFYLWIPLVCLQFYNFAKNCKKYRNLTYHLTFWRFVLSDPHRTVMAAKSLTAFGECGRELRAKWSFMAALGDWLPPQETNI